MTRFIPALVALATLTACGGGLPPARDAQDVEALRQYGRQIDKSPFTAAADLPTGTASYRGGLWAGVTGDVDGLMAGDVALTVDFRGNSLTGRIDNVDITDRAGNPQQALSGDITLLGSENGGRLSARGNGTLRGRGVDGQRGTADVSLGLSGRVRSAEEDGSAIHADVAGSTSGVLDLQIFDGVIAAEAP